MEVLGTSAYCSPGTQESADSRSERSTCPRWRGRCPAHHCIIFCYECGYEALSAHQLATHNAQKHNYKHPARLFCATATCRVCLTNYDTRARCVRHLREGKTSCLQVLMDHTQAMPLCDAVVLDAVEASEAREAKAKGTWHLRARVPAARSQGPLRPIAHFAARARPTHFCG